MDGNGWDDNSSHKSELSDDSNFSMFDSINTQHIQSLNTHKNDISVDPEETIKHLSILLNNILNSRGDYDILDNILRKRRLEIVIKINPSDIVDDTDLQTLSLDERAEVRSYIVRVLSRQQQIYSERNFHHLDNLSLKRMIPDIIFHWKKKSDPESVSINLPLPLVAPMITTPIRDRFLKSKNTNELSNNSSYTKPHPLIIDNSEMSVEDESDAVSADSTSTSNLTISSPTENIQEFNTINSSNNDIHKGNTNVSSTSINCQPKIISKTVTKPNTINLSLQINHGCSKRDQLESYIGLCKTSTIIINATEVYNAYCKWCECNKYEMYTRPMFTKSLRDKWGNYEIKSNTGRSKGWTITLP